MNFQQSGFEGGAQEYDQAARDEVRVAVARATAMSSVEMLTRKGAFEQRAEQFRTSSCHSVGRDEQCRRQRTENPEHKFAG